MTSYIGTDLFFKIINSNLKGMPIRKMISWRITSEKEVFILEIFGHCYFKGKQCGWPGWHWAPKGGAVGGPVPESWESGQLLFLFRLPPALPTHVSLSQIMQIVGSLWCHLWFMKAAWRRGDTCAYVARAHAHTNKTLQDLAGILSLLSHAQRERGCSQYWAWWPTESGHFTFLLPRESRIGEMYKQGWTAALPTGGSWKSSRRGCLSLTMATIIDFPLLNAFSTSTLSTKFKTWQACLFCFLLRNTSLQPNWVLHEDSLLCDTFTPTATRLLVVSLYSWGVGCGPTGLSPFSKGYLCMR